MIFEQIAAGSMQNFLYVIGDDKECAVVDPSWDLSQVLEIAKKHDLKISKILVTHTDFDHINKLKELFDATDATVYVHKEGEDDIKSMGITKIELIEEGSEIEIGKIKVKVLYTPGHKPSNVCFLFNNKIITGDTLFVEGCGRVDMPGGDIRKQFASLQRLKKLSDDIEVYPGHDYGSKPISTIKHEKEHNPYLKCESFEEFSAIR